MRVCLVSREYPPLTKYTGGIGRQFSGLARGLARQGHDVHVATITDRRGRYELLDGVHVHLLREARLSGPLSESRVMGRRAIDVDRLLEAAGPWDMIYAAEWRGEVARHVVRKHRSAVVTNLASSLAKVHEASRSGGRLSARTRSAIQHAIERAQTERSDAIIAPSKAMLDWVRAAWSVDGVASHILPNMIDVVQTRRLAGGALPEGIPSAGPVVLYFGRLEAVKGVDVLVRAMRGLWARGRTERLVLVGRDTKWGANESMATRLSRSAEPHGHLLTFIGNQDPAGLFPAIAAADIVVLPSRWENFSLALLESMAIGKPTVVTSAGGSAELVEHDRDALVVAPGDELALRDAIERLLDDAALRARLGASAAERAEAFDIGPVTRQHAICFDQIARQRR